MAVTPITAGSRLLAEDLLPWSNAINLLLDPPAAQLRQTVAQTLTTGVFTPITFTTEDYDNEGGHSTSSNTSRYVCQVEGRYQLSGKIAYAANSTNMRVAAWRVNGGSNLAGSQVSTPTLASPREPSINAATMTVFLVVSDYVELIGYQDSGGNLNTSVANSETQSYMHVRWIGEA